MESIRNEEIFGGKGIISSGHTNDFWKVQSYLTF